MTRTNMLRCALCLLSVALAVVFANARLGAATVGLETLELGRIKQGWGAARTNLSVESKPMSIGGKRFERGIGTHAKSVIYVKLKGQATRFRAAVGMDDEVAGRPTGVEFQVCADGKLLWKSGVMRPGMEAQEVNVPLQHAQTLLLLVRAAGAGIDHCHADWVNPSVEMQAGTPEIVAVPSEEAVLLTPKPGMAPRINGPRLFGGRPGHPFLYRIPCTGERPINFAADHLPAGLKLNPGTGIIDGVTPVAGEFAIVLHAANRHGRCERLFNIVSGETISLTPQMGFNDWYAYYHRVTDADMRKAADVLISSGMADVGYQYVNVDDCWMGKRDADGNITGNERFPDMKALADYIHGRGLKAGLYTSPGPKTCAGYEGAWQHEAQDARRFAQWGYDFLKYDWCSYGRREGRTWDDLQKPYRLMGDLLKQQDRDIVFNLCQYGMGEVWKWGADVGGNSWRTGDDLGFELDRIFEVALKNCALRQYNKPGGWNDPDYVQIGWIGDATRNGQPRPAAFTPTESYSFMSLWCLMASPLFYSGDISHLDDFTLSVLCNPEVIEVDQDALGQCARLLGEPGDTFVLAKDLQDGSIAVGLCNRDEIPANASVTWAALGIHGTRVVRDLWRQKDLGKFEREFSTLVPRHGVVLVKISKPPSP